MRADFSIASILALASSAAAATIRVDVGAAGLVFSPNVTTAQSGDVLEFHFYPRLHNVVQGDPSKPCQPLSGGFYSGFVPSSSGEAATLFRVTVSSTAPIYYYCSQVNPALHCANGMVGIINGDKASLATYAAGAKLATNATIVTPSSAAGFGGVLFTNTNASSTASGSGGATVTGTGTSSVSGTATGVVTTSSRAAGAMATAGRWTEVIGLGALVGGAAAFMI